MTEEMPDTETGLNLYIKYCEKQIKRNLLLNERLKNRIVWCHKKAEKLGIKINPMGIK